MQDRLHLERPFELDPSVPHWQYRLGMAHNQLGNRSRAVFFLEQAIAHYRPGSSSRKRAELEIQRLEFPLLESSGLARVGALGFLADDDDGSAQSPEAHDVFERGDSIVWWGEIADPYKSQNPKLDVKWMDPSGRSAMSERVAMSSRGRVTSTFDSANARAGAWTVDVSVLDTRIQRRRFELREP